MFAVLLSLNPALNWTAGGYSDELDGGDTAGLTKR